MYSDWLGLLYNLDGLSSSSGPSEVVKEEKKSGFLKSEFDSTVSNYQL